MVALDGTKVAANAADRASRTLAKLKEEVARILRETAKTDQAEDHQHGPARGDELPAEQASPTGRLARLQQAKALLETDAAERQRRTSSGSPSWPPRPGPGQATPGGHQAPTP